jgi:hypothetical protein
LGVMPVPAVNIFLFGLSTMSICSFFIQYCIFFVFSSLLFFNCDISAFDCVGFGTSSVIGFSDDIDLVFRTFDGVPLEALAFLDGVSVHFIGVLDFTASLSFADDNSCVLVVPFICNCDLNAFDVVGFGSSVINFSVDGDFAIVYRTFDGVAFEALAIWDGVTLSVLVVPFFGVQWHFSEANLLCGVTRTCTTFLEVTSSVGSIIFVRGVMLNQTGIFATVDVD